MQTQFSSMGINMKQITEQIFIGSRNDIFLNADIVDNKTNVQVTPKSARFKNLDIKSYLNVAADLHINNAKLPKVGLIDGLGNDKEVLKEAVNKIDELVTENGNVMVFCQKGESISVLVVLAYLYKKKNLAIQKAYDLIRFANPDIKINPYLSLMLFEIIGVKYYAIKEEALTVKAETKVNANTTKKRGRPARKNNK